MSHVVRWILADLRKLSWTELAALAGLAYFALALGGAR